MPVSIPNEVIKEIVEYLDSGMICFFHIPTGTLEYYPDELRSHASFDEELWQKTVDMVENNRHEFIRFEAMESHASFGILETFVAVIAEGRIRQQFEDAISFKNPFQNFKQLLHNYPELRLQWFDFKNQRFMEWVYEQIEDYNSMKKLE